jgi:alkylation response protein AidB-like acyl-CoA dehydrogenase
MQLALSEQNRLVQEAFSQFFRAESSPQRVRDAGVRGFDAKLWAGLVELGAPLSRVPETAGGSAFSLLDAVLMAEESGRHLACAPLAEALVGSRLLAALGGRGHELLGEVGAGRTVLTLAPKAMIPGREALIPGLAGADAVLGLLDEAVVVIDVHKLAAGSAAPAGHGAARLTVPLRSDPACSVLSEASAAIRDFKAGVEEWKVLKAAALVGAAAEALTMASEYACERLAFGKPIGSYQGLSHPLADSICDVDGARLLLWHAVAAIEHDPDHAGTLLSQAVWWASQAGPIAVGRALRTFGGYGLTKEYDVQLYHSRVHFLALIDGPPREELAAVADRLLSKTPTPLPPPGNVTIDFSLGAAAAEFAAKTRAFFEATLTPELRRKAHHSTSGHHPEVHRNLAEEGIIFADWPVSAGGRQSSAYETYASRRVFEECGWTFFLVATTSMVASALWQFGSDEVRTSLLPRIRAGLKTACMGFSEPSCGSDVFAARTSAVRDGRDWVISGQKMFTTGANLADYMLVLARTDPNAKKHAGLSLFLVPLDRAGIEVQAVETLMNERSNIVYLQDVKIGDDHRVGDVNAGATVLGRILENEHGGSDFQVAHTCMVRRAVEHIRGRLQREPALIDDAHLRLGIARVVTLCNVAEVLVRRHLWAVHEKVDGRGFGPMSKLFATESYRTNAWQLMELLAPDSVMGASPALREIELHHRRTYGTTIYAGTSEVHRSLIAEQVLKLPRSRS